MGFDISHELLNLKDDELKEQLLIQRPDRLILVAEAIRRDFTIEDINSITGIDNFFLREIKEIINTEKLLIKSQGILDLNLITQAKKSEHRYFKKNRSRNRRF